MMMSSINLERRRVFVHARRPTAKIKRPAFPRLHQHCPAAAPNRSGYIREWRIWIFWNL